MANEEQPRTPSRSSLAPKKNDEAAYWKKVYIGVGVLAAAAFGGALIFATRPKKTAKKTNVGLTVQSQCSAYTITDMLALRDMLRKELAKQAKIGTPDPFQVTSNFLAQKRFSCTVYPNQVRNPGEADLYATVFYIVTELMMQERLLSDAQRRTFNTMATTWAKSQGANPIQPGAEPEPTEEDGGGVFEF
jgi:hypothetical protein